MAERHARPDDADNNDLPPESDTVLKASPASEGRRWLPAWLVPALAGLLVGVLAGASFVDGSTTSATSATAATSTTSAAAAASAAPAEATTAESSVPAAPLAGNTDRPAIPMQIDVPSIEVSSPMVDLGLNADGTLEVPVDFSKVGWFAKGNLPGESSGPPAIIAGHVDDYTGPAVFYRLGELGVGDEVMVTRADNTVAVFTVTDSQQYAKDAFPADEVYAPVGDSELVLITCTGAFDQGARSYDDNLVVRATLDLDRSLEESDTRIEAGTSAPAGDQPNI